MSTNPTDPAVQVLLSAYVPGSQLVSIGSFDDEHSNLTNSVSYSLPGGLLERAVLKRYVGNGAARRAALEFRALTWLRRQGVPAPDPLFLDLDGVYFPQPCALLSFLSGKQVMMDDFQQESAEGRRRWAQISAQTLARVHAVPCQQEAGLLLEGNTQALWFMNGPGAPVYIERDPVGMQVWHALRAYRSKLETTPPVLLHLDYWGGNLLWEGESITGILDWEEAARGDPGIDVAYARMDLVLQGCPEVAEEFVRAYEEASGQKVTNLAFWELASAVRPMHSPEGWIDAATARERFDRFVTDAFSRLG